MSLKAALALLNAVCVCGCVAEKEKKDRESTWAEGGKRDALIEGAKDGKLEPTSAYSGSTRSELIQDLL